MTNSPAPADLGPVVYEERRHITPAITYTILGSVFLMTGLLCAFTPSKPPTPPLAFPITGGAVAVGGLLCLVIGLVRLIPNIGATWHLHERGVRVVQRGKESALRFDEVDVLTHNIVRVFFHDVCTGEVHEVTFQSNAPEPRTIRIKQVRRPSSVSGADLNAPGDLAWASDQVAGVIATRMRAAMGNGKPAPWVRDVELHAGGIEILSKHERIAWDQVESVSVEDGIFKLWRLGKAKPALRIPTKSPNFFPGYRVLSETIEVRSSGFSRLRAAM